MAKTTPTLEDVLITEELEFAKRPVGASDGCGTVIVNTTALQARVTALETALREIAKMEPQPITEEFRQGPQLLLDNCQRIARKALRKK